MVALQDGEQHVGLKMEYHTSTCTHTQLEVGFLWELLPHLEIFEVPNSCDITQVHVRLGQSIKEGGDDVTVRSIYVDNVT